MSFMDVELLAVAGGGSRQGDARRDTHRSTADVAGPCDVLLAFFATHLEHEPAPPAQGPSDDYPELRYDAP